MDAPTQTQYNPIQLSHDVYRLLLDKGLPVDRNADDFDTAIEGASQILRWLGIEPVIPEWIAGYQQLDLNGQLDYNRRIHGD